MRIFLGCIFILLAGCSTAKQTQEMSREAREADNNRVTAKSRNTRHLTSGGDKILFEGQNNLVEFNHDSSLYNARNSKNVIIVKGSNNNIQFNQKQVVDLSENSRDTLIIEGNQSQTRFNAQQVKDVSVNSANKGVIATTSSAHEITKDDAALLSDSAQIYVTGPDSLFTMKDAFSYYMAEAQKGSPEALYKIGTFFYIGIGTKVNAQKAALYYDYAARKNHAEAARTLGSMYKNGYFEIRPNQTKAKYYYSIAARNGDQDAIEALRSIK